jgi:UDP-glucose 4-epimerase
VRVLDDFRLSSPRNLAAVDLDAVEFVRGDVRDGNVVADAVRGVDAVVHLAAITGAGSSHQQAEEVRSVNADGTETVVDAAEDAGVDRVVLASSCNVYGDTYAEHLTETDDPAPANPYAESKLTAERVCEESPLDSVALRLATNFGHAPGVRFNLVVNTFVFRALVGEPLTVYGDGSNWRPYLHVHDTARAFTAALDWDPGVYNVGWDNVRIEDVAATVADTLDRDVETDYLRERDPGPSYHADFGRMAATGFSPERSLEAGVADLAATFEGGQREVTPR